VGRAPVVVKLSGSLVQPRNVELVKEYAGVLRRLWEHSGARPLVVVGGGATARGYVKACRKLGASEAELDLIGIEVTRLNARLLISALREAALPTPPRTVDELVEALSDPLERIVVMGGLQPGQSTNAVSFVVAELVGAKKVVTATNVDGVYDKDPRKYKDAKLVPRLTLAELRKLVEKKSSRAGGYKLLDRVALSIMERSKIMLHVVNGKNPENVLKACLGEEVGTLVVP